MKKTLLEVAFEMATDLYKAGVIDTENMHEYKSLCAPTECKLSHVPNAKTIAAMNAADREKGLKKITLTQLEEQFKNERKKSKSRRQNKP